MADSKNTLGKRKEREEGDHLAHGSTLFVSNLPYTATSVDLTTLFSDIAPVRSAFVVTEPGTGVSKGVGYVSFALKEDATSAFENLEKDGVELVGRKLRIQWAENKPKEKREKDTVKKEAKPRPPPRALQLRLPHDPLAIRTVVVSGLPSGIDTKVLWKKIRKYDGAEKVDWPIKNEIGVEDPTTAHVLFVTPTHASDTVAKLHAHVYKGALLSAILKKRLDTLSKPKTIPKTSKSKSIADKNNDEGHVVPPDANAVLAPSHASRLIVRNLPFNATEQDLRAIFLPYGPIHSVHIPLDDKPAPKTTEDDGRAESSNTAAAARRPRTRGFAFVWMLSRKDAERAIEGCNGMVVRAGTAQTLVLDKQKRKKVKRLEKKAAAAGIKEGEEEAEEDDNGEDEDMEKEKEEKEKDDKRATERVIAVDWALSREKWKEERAKIPEDADVEMASTESESANDEDEDGLGVHSGSDNDDDDDSLPDDEDDNGDEPVKPQLPPPETGTTLFIRNIPFNATEDDLRTLFRSFGPLRYARITMDATTGRSRGTGFACFWNLVDADRVVQQSDLLRSETTGQPTAPKKNPFSLPSILTPDPSSSLAQSLVLHGRTLDVVRAVTRDVAGKLKEDGERSREKADKRNMYLLREGVILPNTPSASLLTPTEVERRTSSFNARRALLKSNPSLFISKTRLSVRQIPTFVTERMLKRLAGHAVKAFNAEVKRGERTPLTSDELAADKVPKVEAEEVVKVEAGDGDDKPKQNKRKFTGTKDPLVKQTKIIRQAERVDPLTGKGKSKGYGFVDLTKHTDALRFLRWANNNPEVGELFSAWWRDEVEHLLKMARESMKGKGKDNKESQEKVDENDVDKEREEERIKRLKAELERQGDDDEGGQRGKRAGGKGNLIVEFSIENIQVLQRRDASMHKNKLQDKASVATTPGTTDKRRKREHEGVKRQSQSSKPTSDEPSPKKRRLAPADDKVGPQAEPAAAPERKSANPLGSLIGRKRKERKSGKKGGK